MELNLTGSKYGMITDTEKNRRGIFIRPKEGEEVIIWSETATDMFRFNVMVSSVSIAMSGEEV